MRERLSLDSHSFFRGSQANITPASQKPLALKYPTRFNYSQILTWREKETNPLNQPPQNSYNNQRKGLARLFLFFHLVRLRDKDRVGRSMSQSASQQLFHV